MSLRDAGALMAPAEAGLAAYVMALLNWHRRHRFCANCGNATDIAEAGYSRHCPRCGANHFPRTDPVVIMTVEHDDRLLLGRRTGWPAGRLSVLAGFVSPGESAEEAVMREVAGGVGHHHPRPGVRRLAALAVPGLADARLPRDRLTAASPRPPTGSSRRSAG